MRFAAMAGWLVAALVVTVGLNAQVFDFERVRNDFFAGAAGNVEALNRGLAAAEAALAESPKNAQALVVHGFGTVLAGSRELQQGKAAAAGPLFQRGFAEMDEAVRLAPDDGLVRGLRGIILQQATHGMPAPAGAAMLEHARSDFQFLFDAQAATLEQLGTHRLGELLQSLGDIHSRLGRTADAERYYQMIRTLLPATEYASRAGEWLQTRQPLPAAKTACIGCHVAAR